METRRVRGDNWWRSCQVPQCKRGRCFGLLESSFFGWDATADTKPRKIKKNDDDEGRAQRDWVEERGAGADYSSAMRTVTGREKKVGGLEKDLVWIEGSFVQCAGRAVTAGFGIWRASEGTAWVVPVNGKAFRGTPQRVGRYV